MDPILLTTLSKRIERIVQEVHPEQHTERALGDDPGPRLFSDRLLMENAARSPSTEACPSTL